MSGQAHITVETTLSSYLNDHPAGSRAGIELVDTTSRLMQLETLSLGIEGKRMLWKALQQVTQASSGAAGVDFDHLIARAEAQRAEIEPFRLEAAGEGLAA